MYDFDRNGTMSFEGEFSFEWFVFIYLFIFLN